MAALLRFSVEEAGFHLAKPLTDEKLQGLLRPRISRAGVANGGLLLVKDMVERAKHCHTDRVYEAGAESRDSLLCLTEEDFGGGSCCAMPQDGSARSDGKLAPQSVLAELDGIVGLESVKRHMHSLKAQLMVDRKRRAAGMGSSTSPTLHMIFTGNPG